MCQQGCNNEDYWGDCYLKLGYCPIQKEGEKKDYIKKYMTICNNSCNAKKKIQKG